MKLKAPPDEWVYKQLFRLPATRLLTVSDADCGVSLLVFGTVG